jgi:hypothetical protein
MWNIVRWNWQYCNIMVEWVSFLSLCTGGSGCYLGQYSSHPVCATSCLSRQMHKIQSDIMTLLSGSHTQVMTIGCFKFITGRILPQRFALVRCVWIFRFQSWKFSNLCFVSTLIFDAVSFFYFCCVVLSAVVFSSTISLALQVVWMTQNYCTCRVGNWLRKMCKTYISVTLVLSYWGDLSFGVSRIVVHRVFHDWQWDIWLLCQWNISS